MTLKPLSEMVPGTDYVVMDEDAYVLYELERNTPDSKSVHRYRCVQVVRNDNLAEYVWDMGKASRFKVEGFCIPGGGFDTGTIWTPKGRAPSGKKTYWFKETVGSLIDAAEGIHKRGGFDTSEILENRTDLEAGYHQQIDRKRNLNKRQFTKA
jgi:hypothetical protein|tara:strand:+ start:49 stop:507 length:459 start_codon:yes stop_codon:yes gene_type:complete